MINPNKLTGPLAGIINPISNVGLGIVFAAIPVSLVSLFFRYRRSDRAVRQQLKWLVYGATLTVAVLISDFFITLPGVWENIKESLSLLAIPLAVAIAMLRYHLFDIDLIIRRTLQYSLLTGLLSLVYFGGVALLQSMLSLAGGQPAPVVIVLTTLLIAVLFNPLRHRIQDFIDRRFYRQKYDAEKTLAEFATITRSETDLEILTGKLVSAVTQTLNPEIVTFWLLPDRSRLNTAQDRDRS